MSASSQTTPGESNPKRAFARAIVERLRERGFQALWAGGCVRDLVLGLEPYDFDVATDATPAEVMRLFPRTVPVGVSFGVVRVLGPAGAGEVEVATFRSDGRYVDGRRPESVRFGRAEEDARRRDFTINGMFLDPLSGEVLDFVGGQDDLRAGIIRAIGDPRARFSEDKLRLIRAVRFAARFGFPLEPDTRAAVVEMADQIQVVAAERITQELMRMLIAETRSQAVALLLETGLMKALFPPLAARLELDRATLLRATLAALASLPKTTTLPVALATLFHPGLPLELDEAGLNAINTMQQTLRLSNADHERVNWLVRHAGALFALAEQRPCVRKTLLAHPGLPDLLAYHAAMVQARGLDDASIRYVRDYLTRLPEGPLNPEPLLTGDDLKRAGVPPGPSFGRLLGQAREAQLDGTLADRNAALAWLAKQAPARARGE